MLEDVGCALGGLGIRLAKAPHQRRVQDVDLLLRSYAARFEGGTERPFGLGSERLRCFYPWGRSVLGRYILRNRTFPQGGRRQGH